MRGVFCPKTVLALVFFCIACSLQAQQPFSRQALYERIRHRMSEKFSPAVQELIQKRDRAALERAIAEQQKETQAAAASFRGDYVEQRLSESEETESEIHAAINPIDSNNIIVGAMKFSPSFLGANLTFPIYYSKDFGQSWNISPFNGVNDRFGALLLGGGDPVIAFDSKGTAYLSWLTIAIDLSFEIKMNLNWAVSTDGGASWQRQAEPIDGGAIGDILAPSGRLVDKEWMAVDLSNSRYRDNLYIAYAEINAVDTTYKILVRRKEAGQNSLAPAVAISPEEFVFTQFTSIDVDHRGWVHLSFSGATAADTTTTFGMYYTRSTDGGKTFSRPLRVSDLHVPCFPPNPEGDCPIVGIDKTRVYPCPHLRVDRSGGPHQGNLYMVWTADGRQGPETPGMDIYYSRSTDGGASWSPARVLNDDRLPDSHQFFPSLAVNDQGTLVVTWYDRREDPDNLLTNYYMTLSKDGGASFEPAFSVTQQASDFSVIGQSNAEFGIGEYTQVLATRGYALPFWADGRSNDGNIEVFSALVPLAGEQTTSIPRLQSLTDRFSLRGPSPNPARSKAQLSLELKEPLRLSVELYHANGQLMRRLPESAYGQGIHSLELDLKSLRNGQYLVVVRSKAGIQTRPLSVLR